MKKNTNLFLDRLKVFKHIACFTVTLWVFVVHAQTDCVGPAVDKKSYELNPPLWEKTGDDSWQNADGSAQIRLTTQPLRPDLTIQTYAKEFPKKLQADAVKILSKKEIKVGPFDAFAMEGKLRTGSAISRMKSISVFGGSTLYFFTLISDKDVYLKSKACFDAVVQTLKQKKGTSKNRPSALLPASPAILTYHHKYAPVAPSRAPSIWAVFRGPQK